MNASMPYGVDTERSTNDPGGSRVVDPDATADDRLYSTFMHVCVLGNHVGLPLVGFIVSLVLWLTKRDESPFIDDHGREVINFQISLAIWYTLSALLVPMCGLGVLSAMVVYVLALVVSIVNAIRANQGEYVRYPITIRFLA
ncbi:MAG: DUF4870 domain-containing protein [Phycisphaerales bacterium]